MQGYDYIFILVSASFYLSASTVSLLVILTKRQTGNIINSPYFSGKCDYVGRVPDNFK
jgi:hypothetical protein